MPVSLFFSDEQCMGGNTSFVGEDPVVPRMLDYCSSPTISCMGVPIRFAAAPAAPYGKEQVVHRMLDYCSSPTISVRG
uniref:Uncharacterized protein n=1 Tax=Moniliophthora roreri TaxID=221103 RepID=A0A0W0FYS1_MONRR